MSDTDRRWTRVETLAEVKNPWLTLVGERWRDDQHQILDYWRLEKAHSLIVIPQAGDRLYLPKPQFRPGLGQLTWDFPGGRLTNLGEIQATLIHILERELGITPTAILQTQAINPEGWAVNSSFSNQKLYGYWAEINPDYLVGAEAVVSWQIPQELGQLLQILSCLQCRALLREWQCLNPRFFTDG